MVICPGCWERRRSLVITPQAQNQNTGNQSNEFWHNHPLLHCCNCGCKSEIVNKIMKDKYSKPVTDQFKVNVIRKKQELTFSHLGGRPHSLWGRSVPSHDQTPLHKPHEKTYKRFFYIYIRRFYPKRLTVHSGYTFFFYQHICSLGIEPTTFCAANTMLYHWATGILFFLSMILRIILY